MWYETCEGNLVNLKNVNFINSDDDAIYANFGVDAHGLQDIVLMEECEDDELQELKMEKLSKMLTSVRIHL